MILNNIVKSTLVLLLLLLASVSQSSAKDANILAYTDRGIKYYPKYVKKGHVKIGKASWYGKPFHGRLTANGERYNMYGMTAAHRTYAMGTRLKVTNLRNKRSVRVRVNDRGPFYSSRNIDLSYGAARKLGMVHKGVGRVKIEVLSKQGKRYKKSHRKSVKKRNTISKKKKSHKKLNRKKIVKKKILKKKARVVQKKAKVVQKKKKVVSKPTIKRNIKLQLASFQSKYAAERFKKRNKLTHTLVKKEYNKARRITLYKVIKNCTPWERKKLLNSKKFAGAYLVY